ncbi:response regulator [Ancylothrix sp. C2]|uniref:response regulator n=1 Tax=Ancylothrix sp. D3o TaxID=2953691 RepID=UPI0021BAAAAF|nr:response regulator [Ancylothrix sp. D3o]MCT7951755.1 response regulator [Ancylothrix sp. D3o]
MSEYLSDLTAKADILVVDDTPDNLRLLSTMLTEQGYQVRKSINGKLALTAASSHPPDLILLDIMMPDLSGYEVCEKLKADAKTRQIPVIFLSALDTAMDKVKAFEVGGVDYITKPFHLQEVLARVENQLTIQRQQQRISQQNMQLMQQNLQLLQEINARKKAQQELLQANEELKRSNAELEQFAYIASHDLQSPLQVIVGNADMLEWKYGEILGDKGSRYINQIVAAGMRMKQLIEDLLAYSRVGKGKSEFEPTDCLQVLQEVLENLQEEIAGNQAVIDYSELPVLMADKTQLLRLFQNLIGNGIKFHRPDVSPKIKISAEQKQSEWVFCIHDNGIGIETQNFDKIFELFQRLHNYDEYPGTGIGMTICKKIVERHQGRIWVESQVGEGSTFYFTLPG